MKKIILLVFIVLVILVVARIFRREKVQVPQPLPSEDSHESYAPGDYRESLAVGGRTRTYLLHVPPGYVGGIPAPTKPYPLMLSFHGAFGQGVDQAKLSKFSELADKERFIVAYPDGIYREWNDGRGGSRPEKEGIDDVGFISALIDRLVSKLYVDTRRVYANGLSNGSIFSHRLACELSGKITGIGSVATVIGAVLSERCSPERPMPVIMFHGTNDPFNPYGGGESAKGGALLGVEATAEFWAKKNGCNLTPTKVDIPDKAGDGTTITKISYGGCREGADVVLYAVHNGGHTWPSASQYLPVGIIGKTTHNINASELMWEFFRTHPIK